MGYSKYLVGVSNPSETLNSHRFLLEFGFVHNLNRFTTAERVPPIAHLSLQGSPRVVAQAGLQTS